MNAKLPTDTFDDIAEAQGWDIYSKYDLLRQYIANQEDEAALVAFAQEAADIENEYEGT